MPPTQWLVPLSPSSCQPDHREDLEPRCSSQEKERIHALCLEILQPKYQACHSIIDPEPFVRNCLYDMCEYQGMASVLCDNVQSYVEACKSQGVAGISWRNSTFCRKFPAGGQSGWGAGECREPKAGGADGGGTDTRLWRLFWSPAPLIKSFLLLCCSFLNVLGR